jgi:hypothetical protein
LARPGSAGEKFGMEGGRRRAALRDKPPHFLIKQKIGPQRQKAPDGSPWKSWIL